MSKICDTKLNFLKKILLFNVNLEITNLKQGNILNQLDEVRTSLHITNLFSTEHAAN